MFSRNCSDLAMIFLVNNRSHCTVTSIRTSVSALCRFRLGLFDLFLGWSILFNFIGPSDTPVYRSLARNQGVSILSLTWVNLASLRRLLLEPQVVHRSEHTMYVILYCAVRYSHKRCRIVSALGSFGLICLDRPIQYTYVGRFRL